jgi:capsular polysaccharide biosynthesis protein
VLSTLRRPGNAGVMLVCAVAVAMLAYFVAAARSTTYKAEALGVVVPSTSLTPDQANRLAVTYASLIPKDGAIRRRVAAALETTPADAGSRISVVNDSETSLLRVRYRGMSAEDAVAGARAGLLSLTGGNPVSPNIAPRSVGVVQFPARATASKNVTSSVVVGVLLGLGLGALLVIALERGDPRIEDADELEGFLGCPVSAFEPLSDVGVHALVDRWRVIAGETAIRVALLPAREGFDREVRHVTLRLAKAEDGAEPLALGPWEDPETSLGPYEAATNGNGRKDSANANSRRATSERSPRRAKHPDRHLTLVAGHVPGEKRGGEALAMLCDVTVLVVPRRIRRSEVESAVSVLAQFGARPSWMILVGRVADAEPLRPAKHEPAAPALPKAGERPAIPPTVRPRRGPDGRFKAGTNRPQ